MTLQLAYQAEVEAIRTGQLSHHDYAKCNCRGGWFLTDFDTWEECPAHRGQPHPEELEHELEANYCAVVESHTGAPFEGIISWYKGSPIYNHGDSLFYIRVKDPDSLADAQAEARKWSKQVQDMYPGGELRVRLYKAWV